ncbi:PadR family transcriptional regulator [Microbacterium sp. KUDC0406]|uniref:PadR family transcriptional regulator n=1 Tax=Microbacterium sp. KUDC0406 TaxID=2909588 RepID=UPI001F2B811A|nr:PadR family transcriptional regulator [Microbacterium sp. KUDC0406]UJP11446.1 PadR family transcriptional regulator [Microbacterium sp. KUDC0406]
MSVRQSLLAILDQGPCYGYQLRAEFDRRTGSTWPLNVGQIYNTLERLERDGLVERGAADEAGHVYWEITDAGHEAVKEWLDSPVPRQAGTRDELPIKLALAATLPGVDVEAIVQRQRRASLAALQELRRVQYAGAGMSTGDDDLGGEELAWRLVADALIFQAEAEVRWLDHVESRLRRHTPHALSLEISAEKPRRGRPPRAAADARTGA